jgi:hypothetical protein
MTDAERYALLFGPYSTPSVDYGDVVVCEVRGEVVVSGLSNGRIPWPLGKRVRKKGFVVCAGLAEAIRRESAAAVCYWWGITPQTVTKWRKAMGVSELTEGTSTLKRKNFKEDWAIAARQKSLAKARDPERRRKIAESKKGKPRPAHVVAAMQAGRLRAGVSEETRRKLRDANRRRRERRAQPEPRVSPIAEPAAALAEQSMPASWSDDGD